MSKKLLLADDSITIQKVVELVLSEEDIHIKTVNNGQEALNQVEVFKPDIVLADIEMPQLNGYQLCEKIKENAMTSHIPVVLLAGAFEPLDEELAKNVGADDHIIKPFESQELISKVNAVLTSASMSGAGVEVEAGTEEGEVLADATIVAEGIPENTGEAETVEIEGYKEDLWAMESGEPSEEGGGDVWELDEEASIAGEEIQTGAFDIGLSPGVEDKEEIEEIEEKSIGEDEMTVKTEMPIERPPFVQDVETIVMEDVTERVKKPEPIGMPEIKTPSEEAVMSSIRDVAQNKLDDIISKIDLRTIIVEAVVSSVRDSFGKTLMETASDVIKTMIEETLQERFSTLNKEIENIIWETVPDMAENIIKKEIEKLKAEF